MSIPLGAALAACGTSGPAKPGGTTGSGGGGGGGGNATYWYLSVQPQEGVRTRAGPPR
ncbi:hypothetical protein AB0B89_28775 [Sphaerisporangium sp. NPDC049002]|uniref:hypothetical protein n=1 Tax=Sphaerisporangium sp. NPDC049002 TaxID=3155392 RepID=UPI0033E6DFAD